MLEFGPPARRRARREWWRRQIQHLKESVRRSSLAGSARLWDQVARFLFLAAEFESD
jgi:hypothetical protein